MKKGYFLQLGLGLALGGGLLYWVLHDYPWGMLKEVRWRWGWLGLAAVSMTLAHYLRAWRWQLFLRQATQQAIARSSTFKALLIGYFVNLGLPRVGEVVRCALLYRWHRLSISTAIGTVIGERLVDVLLLGLLAVGVVIVEGGAWLDRLGIRHSFGWWAIWFGVGLAGLWVGYRWLRRWQVRFVRHLLEGLVSIARVRPWWLNGALSLGIWLLYWLSTWWAGLGVGFMDFSAWAGWVLLVGSGVAMALPVPGGLGTFHAIGTGLLLWLGYPDAEARTLVLLIHAFQTLLTIGLGVVSVVQGLLSQPRPSLIEGA